MCFEWKFAYGKVLPYVQNGINNWLASFSYAILLAMSRNVTALQFGHKYVHSYINNIGLECKEINIFDGDWSFYLDLAKPTGRFLNGPFHC